jgi:hypothetical protein
MDATESNRVTEFRQFKKRIRGSTVDLVVGLDIGKHPKKIQIGKTREEEKKKIYWLVLQPQR